MRLWRVGLTPHLKGVGGMVSFQGRLAAGLQARGIQVVFDLGERPLDAVLVVGGTRHFHQLWRLKRDGIPIIQRLNGMNWLHRRRRTGLRHFLRAEYGNLILSIIRSVLADRIVYQSRFSQDWWERVRGPTSIDCQVVYNAVDLDEFSPTGGPDRPPDRSRILMVEGSLGGGYDLGLAWGVGLLERLHAMGLSPELVVAGKASQTLRDAWQKRTALPLDFLGLVPLAEIPALDRSAHLLFASDLHAACPNSVIEALACGLPVVGLDTGALNEIVKDGAGEVTAYGGDPWRLDSPDLDSLARAAAGVLADQESYRRAARSRAEAQFGVGRMLDSYLQAMGVG